MQFTDTQEFIDDIHSQRIQLFSDIWKLKKAAENIYVDNRDLYYLGPKCLEELSILQHTRQQSLLKHKSDILNEISQTTKIMLEKKKKSMDILINQLQQQLDQNDERTKNMLTKIDDDIADAKNRSATGVFAQSSSRQRKNKRTAFFNSDKILELREKAYLMKFSEVVALWNEHRGSLRYRELYDYLAKNSMNNFDPENCSLKDLDYIHSQFDPENEIWDMLDAHLRHRFLYGDESMEEWRKLKSIRFAVAHKTSKQQKPRTNWGEVIDAGLALEFLEYKQKSSFRGRFTSL